MTEDNTESLRRAMIMDGIPELDLEKNTGPTWNAAALQRDFEVLGFLAPFVMVRRKADGVKGSLEFIHSPRVYFNWKED